MAEPNQVRRPLLIARDVLADRGGPRAMNRTMKMFLALFLSGSACYVALLWGFRLQIFQFLYADKYAEYASWPLLLVGALSLTAGAVAVFGSGLRAGERTDLVFWCYVAPAFAAVIIGLTLAWLAAVAGTLGGMVVSSLATALLLLWFGERNSTQQRPVE